MDLLSELKAVIPLGEDILAAKVPVMYEKRFNKKYTGSKLSTLLLGWPHIFQMRAETNSKNPNSTIFYVKQLPSTQNSSSKPVKPNVTSPAPAIVKTIVPAPVVKKVTSVAPSVQKVASKMASVVPKGVAPVSVPVVQKVTAPTLVHNLVTPTLITPKVPSVPNMAVPVKLNDRTEVTVPLTEVTAYLRSAKSSIPRGGLSSFVLAKRTPKTVESNGSLITEKSIGAVGSSLLGLSLHEEVWKEVGGDEQPEKTVYLNTNEPFCAICIGVQGAGKSHTMNVVLENCLLGTVEAEGTAIISTTQPMCGLVLHYDQSQSNVCEAVGLSSHASQLSQFPELKVNRLVVLVSPTYYLQRKAFYGNHCEVIPLLFDWDSLTATQLKKLMRLSDTDAQLYVSVILNKLREYQRKNKIPSFEGFLSEVTELCNVSGQSAPLVQRLELLKSVVRESEPNKDLKGVGYNLTSLLSAGTLVVADLTDPMMSADEACGVFQVLLEQFRSHPLGDVGKVVTFDEAHKYLNKSGPGCIELSNAIVDTVRLMRHEGIRVLISTQSPLTMPPELLELASVTILHKFQSADWAKYLGSKVTLPPGGFEEIQSLLQGQALLLSTQIDVTEREDAEDERVAGVVNHLKVSIRPRLTLDLGASRRNKSGEPNFSEEFEELHLSDSESDVESEY